MNLYTNGLIIWWHYWGMMKSIWWGLWGKSLEIMSLEAISYFDLLHAYFLSMFPGWPWSKHLSSVSCSCLHVGGQPTLTLNPLKLSQNESSLLTLFQSGIFVTLTRKVINTDSICLKQEGRLDPWDSLIQPIKLIFLSLKVGEVSHLRLFINKRTAKKLWSQITS